ncbi:uncharacterized protein LOC134478292 isoform X2 [Cavia porcellus]|uniref:uncharacterized protein LOC134478292 isoform X2 n=2 Tax=Cavia porcellus TaxID=10141 RepID=UPI002FDF4920
MTPALLREEARGHQLVSDSVRIRPVGRSVGPRPPLRAARVQSPAVTGLGSAHAAAQRWAGNRGDRRDPEQDTRADRVDRCDRRPPRPAPRAPLSRSRDPEAAVTCARDKHGKMAPATLRGAAASQRSSADRGENKGGAAAGAVLSDTWPSVVCVMAPRDGRVTSESAGQGHAPRGTSTPARRSGFPWRHSLRCRCGHQQEQEYIPSVQQGHEEVLGPAGDSGTGVMPSPGPLPPLPSQGGGALWSSW